VTGDFPGKVDGYFKWKKVSDSIFIGYRVNQASLDNAVLKPQLKVSGVFKLERCRAMVE
jgi:hypothetical protein